MKAAFRSSIPKIVFSKLRLSIYEQLLKSLNDGNKVTMINVFNTGIIIDVEKVGKKAIESIMKMEKKRLERMERM
jgi:hypothetical protein